MNQVVGMAPSERRHRTRRWYTACPCAANDSGLRAALRLALPSRRRGQSHERPGDAQPLHRAAIAGKVPVAVGGAQIAGRIVPGAAAHDAPGAVPRAPRGSVARIARVGLVPAVLGPVPDVAVYAVAPPWIGAEAVDRHRSLPPLALRPLGIGGPAVEVGLFGR